MTRLTTTDGGATKTQVVGAIGVVKWNLILVSLIPHPHTLICQHLGLQYHFVDTSILLVFCFGVHKTKETNSRLQVNNTLCLGARLPWSGCHAYEHMFLIVVLPP